ncbi:MAG: hypothetical protein ACAF41_23070 [Leptolyngbya sp. BL-A-14]
MSDTTAFIGGAVMAGLAAFVLVKSSVGAGAPTVTSPQPLPMPSINVPASPLPVAALPSPTECNLGQADLENKLKSVLDPYRAENEKLKAQAQTMQASIDSLTAQIKASNAAVQNKPAQDDRDRNALPNGMIWALSGIGLTFGVGIAMVLIFMLLARHQQPGRTIEVIHTMDDHPQYPANRRRTPLPPARRVVTRRVNSTEID